MREGLVKLLLTAGLSAVGVTFAPVGGGVALAHPTADFDWTPKPVVAGNPVTFQSTSIPHDLLTPITEFTWGLDGRATCTGTAASATCLTTAPAAGPWLVTLRVRDTAGEFASITRTIPVEPPAPPPPPPPNAPPRAAFAAAPTAPRTEEEVTFVSYSDDADGTVTAQNWDLDGDGAFDDATGAVARWKYSQAGAKRVALRVTDNGGAASTTSLTIQVLAPPPPPSSQPLSSGSSPVAKLLSPFPIVRLVGSAGRWGTDIALLTVRAPRGAKALVRCRGRECPIGRQAKTVVRRAPVRFKAAERTMPTGVILEVLVRRGNRIGKFTRFKFRPNRRPVRVDRCLWPDSTRMARCPES